MKILFYGYGNPGRQDDALGIEFVHRLEASVIKEGLVDIDFEENFQLNVEDALEMSQYDKVFFVDASYTAPTSFSISPVKASNVVNFSVHTMSPAYLKYLCKEVYDTSPEVSLIQIKGYEWELEEGLTPKAERNLRLALEAIQEYLENSISPMMN